MCFIKDNHILKTATKDIICYKLSRQGLPKDKSVFTPFFMQRFKYAKNVATKTIRLEKKGWTIDRGYHTCKTMTDCKRLSSEYIWREKKYFGKFIIPKGTKYYENRTEYVSETLIFKGYIK